MTVAAGAATRDEALDYVKGCLVLVMVLYHWLNYFFGLDWWGYRYLRFLTPSFIFLTGFLVSHVYLARFPYDSPMLRRRLLQRGTKLLLLFVVLNVAVTAVELHTVEPWRLAASWPVSRIAAVFLRSAGGAAFGILLSIAYFLIAAPVVLQISKRSGLSLSAIAAVALGAAICLSLVGTGNLHAEMLSIAFVGLAVGAPEHRRVQNAVNKPGWLLLGYLLYVVAITIFNVPFWLQIIGVCLSVALLYAIGLVHRQPAGLRQQIIDLGKYSLFAYVVQIAVLQILRRALSGADLTAADLAGALALALLATVGLVRLASALRASWPIADRWYRAVFA
jgi:peptidoglycan/LPS O-acetylase OafA/YrhL